MTQTIRACHGKVDGGAKLLNEYFFIGNLLNNLLLLLLLDELISMP